MRRTSFQRIQFLEIAIGNPLKSSPDFPPLHTGHERFRSSGVPSYHGISIKYRFFNNQVFRLDQDANAFLICSAYPFALRSEITFPHSVLWWIPTLHGARCVRPCKLRQDLSNCHLRHQPYELYGGNEYRQFQETCTLWRISPAGRNRAPNGYRCTQCSRFLRDAPSDNTKWKC